LGRHMRRQAWALVVAQRIRPELFARMRAAAAAATAAGAASHDHYSPAILSQLYQVSALAWSLTCAHTSVPTHTKPQHPLAIPTSALHTLCVSICRSKNSPTRVVLYAPGAGG
jgi:hypothetical protein